MGVIHERIRLNPHVQECAEQVLSEIFLELGPRGRGGPEILQAAGDFHVPEEDLLIVPGSNISSVFLAIWFWSIVQPIVLSCVASVASHVSPLILSYLASWK